MGTRGPVCTEVDAPLAQAGEPTPEKMMLSVADGQGFRPLGMGMVTPGAGVGAVDTTMSLGPARPSPGLRTEANSVVGAHQLSPLQQHLHQAAGGQAVGHFPSTLPAHLSPHFSAQRHGVGAGAGTGAGGGTPRQQHPQPMGTTGGVASKVSRSHVEVRRRTPQDGLMESRAHPIVSRPVANMGQPVQGSPAGLGGSLLGKPQQMMMHRPQGSPQDKGGHIQKPAAAAQRQAIQRAHARAASWQTPLGQPTPGTPSGQSRVFYPHPVLNAQARSSPQEQGRQHPVVAVVPQLYPQQQQQLRDGGPVGVKSLPIFPVLRTPVAGNHTNNHNDTAYRERPSDSPIVVHIGDRKVRLLSESDPSSLYSLCRRWVRNDTPRADRSGVRDAMNIPLPRPLSATEVESAGDYALDNGIKSDPDQCQPEVEKPLDLMTDEELLQSHIQHFKTVRKRSKEDRMRRIARFKPRLALLLPESG